MSAIDEAIEELESLGVDDVERRFDLRRTGPGGAAAFEENIEKDLRKMFVAVDTSIECLEEARNIIIGLENDVDDARGDRDELTKEKERLEAKFDEVQEKLYDARERLQELSKENETLEQRIDKLISERDDALEEARIECNRANACDTLVQGPPKRD